jgi:hypothetical protein
MIRHFKTCGCSVQTDEPRLCVGETETFASSHFERAIDCQTGTVVSHFDMHGTVSRCGAYFNMTGTAVYDRVFHRILDDWLQDQVWNASFED